MRKTLAEIREYARKRRWKITITRRTVERRKNRLREAARILGVHPATVSRWVAAGHFEMVTGPGKHPLIATHSLHRPTPKSKGRKG